MKIVLCNIAIRGSASLYPPIACTSLIHFLKANGYDAGFYNIDLERPSWDGLRAYFLAGQFDLVGISAVVSTGYRYIKDLSRIIKEVSPRTRIVAGGNLAQAYEVLLRKCPIDVCVIGEGEKPLLGLARHFEGHQALGLAFSELSVIQGIAFFDQTKGQCVVTGPVDQIEPRELMQPDYEFLSRHSDVSFYLSDPMLHSGFAADPRSREPQREGKRTAVVIMSKGCVNSCTFCHRWIRGYRILPVERVVEIVKRLKDRYNVGFFSVEDECFGEDHRWLEEFIRAVKPLDILFNVTGTRVSFVKKDPSAVRRLKDVGMVTMDFGMESGSDKMLAIMEKNATVQDNLLAIRSCAEAGVFTTIQLVIGMPGENDRTIDETIDFVVQATRDLPGLRAISSNYLQILPGTPCYDFLKLHKFIGSTVEDEEEYLLKVSDIDAADFAHYINVSEAPLSRAMLWKKKIRVMSRIGWLKAHGWRFSAKDLDKEEFWGGAPDRTTLKARLMHYARASTLTYRMIDFLNGAYWELEVFRNRCQLYGVKSAVAMAFGVKKESEPGIKVPAQSLRKVLRQEKGASNA